MLSQEVLGWWQSLFPALGEASVGMMAEPLHWFKRGGGKFPQFLLCVTGAKTSGVLTCACVPTLNKHVNTALGVPGQ